MSIRHKQLLKCIFDIFNLLNCPEEGIDYSRLVIFAKNRPWMIKIWHFYKDNKNLWRSIELKEDLNYLHQRGYIYCDYPQIILTQRAFYYLNNA